MVVKVVDAKNKVKINNAIVKAVSYDKKQFKEKTKDGEVKLLNISNGECEITLSADGYKEKTAKIKLNFSEQDVLSAKFSMSQNESIADITPINKDTGPFYILHEHVMGFIDGKSKNT